MACVKVAINSESACRSPPESIPTFAFNRFSNLNEVFQEIRGKIHDVSYQLLFLIHVFCFVNKPSQVFFNRHRRSSSCHWILKYPSNHL